MATNPLKKKKPGLSGLNVAGIGAVTPSTKRTIAAPRPSAPPPVAPAPVVPPGFTPPGTRQAANVRSTAESTYQSALRQGRQGIVDAAIRLGSPEIMAALRADPNFAEYVGVLDKGSNDPSSQFAQAAKDEKEGLENTDLNTLGGNTYFSSRRSEARQDLSDDFTAARAGYLKDYNTGYNTLTGGMGAAKGQYENDLRDADQIEQEAYLASQPQPMGPPISGPRADVRPNGVPIKGNQVPLTPPKPKPKRRPR